MTVPILLHLMRHGEPVMAGRMIGWTDCAVTETGIAACVARAEGVEIAQIVSSDLNRAAACAAAIAGGREVTRDPRWRELDFGDWDGLAAAEIDPTALGLFWDDPDANPPVGGKRWADLVARISAGLVDLVDGTLVVTHAGAMRAALAAACGFGVREGWAIDLPYAALLSLRIWPGPMPSAQIVGLRT